MTRRTFADSVISKVDKDRRSGAQKAHDENVRLSAYQVATRLLAQVGQPDRHRYRDGMLDAIRDNATADVGCVSASSQIAAKAEQPMTAPSAVERAVREFDKLTGVEG
jgi:hypothetical protein